MNVAVVYPVAFFSSALVTAASVPLWRRWCLRAGAVDDPGHRKIHHQPIPLAGGLAVMTGLIVPLLAGVVVAFAWSRLTVAGLFQYGLNVRAVPLLGIVAGGFGMLFIGLQDDLAEWRPAPKFAGQLLIALLIASVGIRITLFVPSVVFSYVITAFWVLAVVNAFNFMDNMNGLCAGLGAIGAGWFAAIAALEGQYLVAAMGCLMAGALCGFLPFNYPRATVFLGDAGSHLTGYLLAVMAILPHFYSVKHPKPLAVLTPLLVLAMPLGDMAWVVWLRWRMGKPFYIGDTNHLSHRLTRRGLAASRAVLLIWLGAAAAGGLAFLCQ